ncbi:hypothetical protein [Nocardia asiatica]|uniref:hypothetical protein n=1 Tax=Nocardia asiatica TaxID=209252 RepID=UPI0005C12CD3|nr:hypothetical protein [Nocardia asiatica]
MTPPSSWGCSTPPRRSPPDAAARREAWAARFQRADWITPSAGTDGTPARTVRTGWRCPACGHVEPNGFVLAINHGLDPDTPPTAAAAVTDERFRVCLAMRTTSHPPQPRAHHHEQDHPTP